jgi:hypothetical protein
MGRAAFDADDSIRNMVLVGDLRRSFRGLR